MTSVTAIAFRDAANAILNDAERLNYLVHVPADVDVLVEVDANNGISRGEIFRQFVTEPAIKRISEFMDKYRLFWRRASWIVRFRTVDIFTYITTLTNNHSTTDKVDAVTMLMWIWLLHYKSWRHSYDVSDDVPSTNRLYIWWSILLMRGFDENVTFASTFENQRIARDMLDNDQQMARGLVKKTMEVCKQPGFRVSALKHVLTHESLAVPLICVLCFPTVYDMLPKKVQDALLDVVMDDDKLEIGNLLSHLKSRQHSRIRRREIDDEDLDERDNKRMRKAIHKLKAAFKQ